MKISEHFILQEYIDPDTWKQFGESCIWFIDRRIILIGELIRTRFDKEVTVNNWCFDRNEGEELYYQFSGFRPENCSIGAYKSDHKFGRAGDFKILSMINNGADEMRDDMRKNFSIYQKVGLTTIEDAKFAPNWCHASCRWTNQDDLLIIKP